MSEFFIVAIVAISAVVGVSGVLTYLLLGTMRAGLSSVEPLIDRQRSGHRRRHAKAALLTAEEGRDAPRFRRFRRVEKAPTRLKAVVDSTPLGRNYCRARGRGWLDARLAPLLKPEVSPVAPEIRGALASTGAVSSGETDQLAPSHLARPHHRAAFSTAPLCGVRR